jgi:hypothetical protein
LAIKQEESLKNFEDRKFVQSIDRHLNPNQIERNYITIKIFIAWILNFIFVYLGLFYYLFIFFRTYYFPIFSFIYFIFYSSQNKEEIYCIKNKSLKISRFQYTKNSSFVFQNFIHRFKRRIKWLKQYMCAIKLISSEENKNFILSINEKSKFCEQNISF